MSEIGIYLAWGMSDALVQNLTIELLKSNGKDGGWFWRNIPSIIFQIETCQQEPLTWLRARLGITRIIICWPGGKLP